MDRSGTLTDAGAVNFVKTAPGQYILYAKFYSNQEKSYTLLNFINVWLIMSMYLCMSKGSGGHRVYRDFARDSRCVKLSFASASEGSFYERGCYILYRGNSGTV